MKIGVLTLPLHVNYGGIIQAYALKTVLERRGHDVWFINRDLWPAVCVRKKPGALIRGVRAAYNLRNEIPLRTYRGLNDLIHIQRKSTQNFINTYIDQRISKRNIGELTQNGLEALIVGSDQIWRPSFAKGTLKAPVGNAFLSFAVDWKIRRLSYAASFGAEEWEFTAEETQQCSELLKMFDALSVRESSGVRLCAEYLGVTPEHVLDPSMLLDSVDYSRLIGADARTEDRKGVFAYILDNTEPKTRVVNKVASFANTHVLTQRSNEAIIPSVESWLRSFRDARFVVTDSFHGCVFSIIFSKPFFVFGNRTRGIARTDSLLSLFSLQDRQICSQDDLSDEKLTRVIDWGRIHGQLSKERTKSLNFLESALAE